METSFEIFGLVIGEPITMLTDLLVGFVGVRSYILLNRLEKRTLGLNFFKYFFLLMGIATAVSGVIGHGFIHSLHIAWKLPGWIISMFSIMFVERASIVQAGPYVSKTVLRILKIANIVELAVFIVITVLTTLDYIPILFNFETPFYYVGIHSAYGLAVVVMPLQYFILAKTGRKGNKWIANAASFSSLAAIVYIFKISLGSWFNYYDISHLIMAICLHYVYLGTKELYAGDNLPEEVREPSLI